SRTLAIGDGQPGTGRNAGRDRGARAAGGNRHRRRRLRRRDRLATFQRVRHLSQMAPSLSAGNHAQYRTCLRARRTRAGAGEPRAARTFAACVAAVGRGGRQGFFMGTSRRDRSAAGTRARHREEFRMNQWMNSLLVVACAAWAGFAVAADPPPPPTPVVTLTASATASVANDRMYAWL